MRSCLIGLRNQIRNVLSHRRLYMNSQCNRKHSNTVNKMKTIVKSENDKREYRLITLSNQLRALLISDVPDGNGAACQDHVDALSDHEMSQDEASSGSGEESGHESDMSDCDMEDGISHGMPLEHNEKKSAAALCIGAGSFSDPEDIPGFAHFLEHMVFMGSEKYPKENELDDFLGKHGGYSNAWTDCERTCFYFEIERKYFYKALDKFAQFFICPLLLENAVDREIQAVDSEFQMTLPCDDERLNQLLGTFAKTGHPMSKFFTGNTDTLKKIPEERGLNIYEKLRAFYEKIYSAQYMTLAIHSRDSLDKMEEWVREIFTAVPNNNLPKVGFHDMQNPFDTDAFRKLHKVIPVKNTDKLVITWAYPPLLDKYRYKPLDYLSVLLSHEGKGSILSYLRKKFWASSIVGGTSFDGLECNSTWTCFSLEVTLTDKGFENYLQVIQVIFAYINILRKEGPKKWIFDEQKMIDDTRFRWKEQIDPIDYVEKIAENMQMFEEEDILTGRLLLFEYDEKLIRDCIDQLQPDRCNFILSSQKFKNQDICHNEEYWYKTKYCSTDIESELIKSWKNPPEYSELSLPPPNRFIATDFTLHQIEEKDISQYPDLKIEDKFCKFWYKKDTKFKVPKGSVYVHFTTPIVNRTLQSAVMYDLFVNILQQNIVDSAYSATLAGYEYNIEGFDTGLVVTLKGFNHKIQDLFQLILDEIFEFTCSDGLFDMMKEQLKKTYQNELLQPYELASILKFSVIKPVYWPLSERVNAIDDVTKDMMEDFIKELLAHLFVEGFLSGNFTPENVTAFENSLKTKLKDNKPLPNVDHLKKRLLEIPKDRHYCQLQSFNLDDANSCVTVYLQSLPGTLYTCCLNELLATRMHEPCFDILRTKHQLGYSVFAEGLVTAGILGLSITVEYQATKFSVQQIDQHIQDFLKEFEVILNETSADDFAELVDSLVVDKLTEDSNLQEETDRHWREICNQTCLFNRQDKEGNVEILNTLKLETLKGWFTQYLGNAQKALSFQILGKGDDGDQQQKILSSRIEPIKISVTGSGENSTNGYPSFKCLLDKNQTNKPISDVFAFKNTLKTLPFTKIVK